MNDTFEIGCPKCSSTQITADKKGYSAGKAVTGAILTGGIGLLAGLHGSKKVIITCLACGHSFKAGEGKKIFPAYEYIGTKKEDGLITDPLDLNRIVCSTCKKLNYTNFKYCYSCSRELTVSDQRVHSDETIRLKSCLSCKNLTPVESFCCVHCKKLMKQKIENPAGCIVFCVLIIIAIVVLIMTFLS